MRQWNRHPFPVSCTALHDRRRKSEVKQNRAGEDFSSPASLQLQLRHEPDLPPSGFPSRTVARRSTYSVHRLTGKETRAFGVTSRQKVSSWFARKPARTNPHVQVAQSPGDLGTVNTRQRTTLMISLLSGGKAARFVRHGRPLRAAYHRGPHLRKRAR